MASKHEEPPPTQQPCQTCATVSERTFTCIQCNNLAFCDTCWSKWVLHLPGAVGWNGKPHEKADPLVVYRLRQILEPARTEEQHQAELLEDQDTTWFGFGRDGSGHPQLYDYGRFAAIMNETHTDEYDERYPQLASFIGETGAGKSTLIKLLIDRHDISATSTEGSKYFSPVTSSNQDRIATTGDVHLYPDPSSLYSANPLLFVDCEGLSGGEATPKQLRQNQDTSFSQPSSKRYSAPRKIEWAETPQTQKREFAVSQLYPRILYTFSDTVVFVLRNPRSFESTVLNMLIKWGAASIDKSINQPVLPHAIIVLNATDPGVDEREWDVAKCTQMLMSDIRDAIHREPVLQQYAQTWRQRGRRLNDTKDLLECYYASVNVIRIPYKGSYMLMHEQVDKLSALIKDRSAASHAKKRQTRMLASAEKLQFYLQAAYDHFTRDLHLPFDFVKEMLRHSPVSRNFEGNILNLAVLIKNSSAVPDIRNNAEEIFTTIGPMVASCIMLDAVRQKLPGTISRLLDDRYAKACVGAMESFAEFYWPCSFRNPAYPGELGHCCNVKSGHNPKGHQNKQGKIIGNGSFQADFDAVSFQPMWEHMIRGSLVQVQSASFRLAHEYPNKTELEIAAALHQERLNGLFTSNLGSPYNLISFSSCLCCLRELPECALPCGHVLCLPCVETYGQRTSKTTIEIKRCPIHVHDIIASPPWVITTKPRFAGVRTLCLDGGGIRSIAQLHTLREIEKILGPDLPIQLFFDLIVGTDFGGIIALGLGVKKWSVSGAIERFKDLCQQAYTARGIANVPFSGALSVFYHKSLYREQPFEAVLRRYLSEQPLFGGVPHRSWTTVSNKVAVTATAAISRHDVVFANYNRPDTVGKNVRYRFSRSDTPQKEMRIWEAARATTATAPLFAPFKKVETEQQYSNSGAQSMCPIMAAHHETTSIWKDTANAPPDIMLSIGAGRNIGDRPDNELVKTASIHTNASEVSSAVNLPPSAVVRQGRGGMGNYKRRDTPNTILSDEYTQRKALSGYIVRNPQAPLLVTFNNPIAGQTDRLNDQKQCEMAWSRFVKANVSRDPSVRQRYRRVCPEVLTKLPKFDDVGKIDQLEREVQEVLRINMPELVEIAHRLVASTFFFEKDVGSVKQKGSGFTCTGTICCRFPPHSIETKGLAWFLISLLEGDFEPYFLIEEEDESNASWPVRHVVLTPTILQDMHMSGNFELEQLRISAPTEDATIKISLCLQHMPYPNGAHVLPISGFPRRLISEDGVGMPHNVAPITSRSHILQRPSTSTTNTTATATTGPSTPRTSTSIATTRGGAETPITNHSRGISRESIDKLSLGSPYSRPLELGS